MKLNLYSFSIIECYNIGVERKIECLIYAKNLESAERKAKLKARRWFSLKGDRGGKEIDKNMFDSPFTSTTIKLGTITETTRDIWMIERFTEALQISE